MVNHAIDALENERDVLREKINVQKCSLDSFKSEVVQDVKDWERRAAECDTAIHFLRKNIGKIKASTVTTPGNGTRGAPKNMAKCNDKSYFFCIKQCPQRADRTCTLVRYRKNKK